MANNAKIESKLRIELKKYKKFALYGTGEKADYIIKVLKRMGKDPFIQAIVDRDDSNMIGKEFHGHKVRRFVEVIEDIDAVIIASSIYWSQIKGRLEKVLEQYQIDIPIIAIFDFTPKKIRGNNIEDYEKYVQYLENRQLNRDEKFVSLSNAPYQYEEGDSKIIAWYLPQYYQMDVNDKYHGKGFTEWTNSSQAFPLYVGHEQPHIPYDVGYYTLNTPDIMKRQIDLAKRYGIYGFCFHYYWFSGEKMMEKPINMLLEHKELDIPFCINWATENWTTAWDGSKYDMIYEQKLNAGDDEKFMKDILPFFHDSRYIKIEGKPLLIIYSVKFIEKKSFAQLIDSFQKIARREGFKGIYILLSNYNNFDENVQEYGADALVEFMPSFIAEERYRYQVQGYLNPYFAGEIYDLKKYVFEKEYMRQHRNKQVYRSALVSFDNTSRKARWGGVIFHGSSPENYKMWLSDILQESKRIHDRDHDYVFVHSWNEWAEGSHLEPDIRNGYAYLEATCDALYQARGLNTLHVKNEVAMIIKNKNLPHFYVMCVENMAAIITCEPIVRYLKEEYPASTISWIVREDYAELIGNNPHIDEVKKVSCMSEAIEFCSELNNKENTVIVDCHYNGCICAKTGRVHVNRVNPQINEKTYLDYGTLLEGLCLTAGIKPIKSAPLLYKKNSDGNPFKQEKYVVFHCKSSKDYKNWESKKWNDLAKRIINKGYKVIEIGFESELNIEHSNYIDYTGRKKINILVEVINDAHSFIGIDSGFAHIANCFSKRSVILLGNYKNNPRVMPYTGYFYENKERMMVYPEKWMVREIDVSDVISQWEELNQGE